MYKGLKIILGLLAAFLLSGCRSAKPAEAYEATADSISISVESLVSVRKDSVSLSEECLNQIKEAVEFVEGGGSISICSDGSVEMSGVAKLKTSKQNASASRAESQNLAMQAQSKDSIAAIQAETIIAESKPSDTRCGVGNGLIITSVLLTLILIIIMIFKIKRTKIFNL